MESRLMAIWKYDLPPYYKGGEIERFTMDGKVIPKGYGETCFEPVKILPLNEIKLCELKKMYADCQSDIDYIRSAYKYKAELLFGILGVS